MRKVYDVGSVGCVEYTDRGNEVDVCATKLSLVVVVERDRERERQATYHCPQDRMIPV